MPKTNKGEVATKSKKPSNTQIALKLLSSEPWKDQLVYILSLETFALYKDNKYFKILDPKDFKRELWRRIVGDFSPKGVDVTEGLVKDVYSQMRYGCMKVVDEPEPDTIVFDDGILDLRSMTLLPHDKDRVDVFYQPYEYKKLINSEAPTFQRYLSEVLVKEDTKTPDEDLIKIMQEIFGYVLISEVPACISFFFTGEGSNGKSVMTSILSRLVGKDYFTAMSVGTLTTNNFAGASLVGKRLNACNDDESRYLRTDKFKALVSGDPIHVERKYGDPFTFSPRVKFVFCSNNMPTFDSIDYGLRRRVKLIPFFRKFTPEEKDLDIGEKIASEMEGVIKWALDGLARLRANNMVFTTAEASEKAIDELESETSAVARFFKENLDIVTDGGMTKQDTYDLFKKWCELTGKKQCNLYKFNDDLERTCPGTAEERPRMPDGSRPHLRPVRLKPDSILNFTEMQVPKTHVYDERRTY